MKFVALRRYIKSKNLQKSFTLQNCDLVIDGDSFFKNSYKKSGCQFVLGPDCDRYADYLIAKLTCFLDSNIKCHVIFNGTSKDDLEQRQERHQNIINDRRNIAYNLNNPKYFDPLFVKDVQLQVLDELGIKYFCCEYDSMEAIVGVAREFKCPVLTENLEYCLFKVSCILPDSVVYEKSGKELQCVSYEHQEHQELFGVFSKTPVLLTVLSNKEILNNMLHLSYSDGNCDVPLVIRWVKSQSKNYEASMKFEDENTRRIFMDVYDRIKKLYLYPSDNLAVNYFRRKRSYGLFKDARKWFSKGISDGRIGLPYVDIKRRGFITGSVIVNDINKPDAILAAEKIIAYIHALLTNSQSTTLTYIERKNTDCVIREKKTDLKTEINNRNLFVSTGKKYKKLSVENNKLFTDFFKDTRPTHNLLKIVTSDRSGFSIPRDCWILVTTLIYYIENVNEDFVDGAYFIILSYLLLGPVSNVLNEDQNMSTDVKETAKKMYNQFKFLFRKVDLRNEFNTAILHSLAEFQHCLQHMNYLNNLCGQSIRGEKIPCTIYHDSYSATVIYNAFMIMRNKDNLMKYLDDHFSKDDVFIKLYKKIIHVFQMCREPSKEVMDWLSLDGKLQLMFSARPFS